MNEEEKKAIEYYKDKEVSFSVDFDTEKLLKALGITEEDSFENHQIRFKTLLKLIEKLQKENEELRKENSMIKKVDKITKNITTTDIKNTIKEAEQQYIPVQKVKDKIEEIQKRI